MSFDVPSTDTVYVQGLPADTTEHSLGEFFGSIGIIKIDKKTKKPKIWLYRDKTNGELKGDGTVSYEDPFTASSAIEWFNGKEWNGSVLSVSLSERKDGGGGGGGGAGFGGGGGGGRGGGGFGGGGGGFGGGGGGGGGFPQDWNCNQCGNTNFARRTECNKCKAPKPGADGGGGGGGGAGGGMAGGGMAGGMGRMGSGGPPAAGGFGGPGPGAGAGGHAGPGEMGGPPPPRAAGPPPRDGDWACGGCGNNCFSFRNKCNKCGMAKPAAARGGPAAGAAPAGGPGGARPKVVAAPQGPLGLFQAGDWACSSCGNMNWGKRDKCNMCNMPKPGMTEVRREGTAGGFKELDEAEVEAARKRRKEFEEKDQYDEFGRLKRQFRGGDRAAREAAALARLRGDYDPSPSGQEAVRLSGLGGGEEGPGRAEGEDTRGVGRDVEQEREREREREAGRVKERERSPARAGDDEQRRRRDDGVRDRRDSRDRDRRDDRDRDRDREDRDRRGRR